LIFLVPKPGLGNEKKSRVGSKLPTLQLKKISCHENTGCTKCLIIDIGNIEFFLIILKNDKKIRKPDEKNVLCLYYGNGDCGLSSKSCCRGTLCQRRGRHQSLHPAASGTLLPDV